MRVRIRDVVAPVFWPVHRAIARGTVQELVAKGGRRQRQIQLYFH